MSASSTLHEYVIIKPNALPTLKCITVLLRDCLALQFANFYCFAIRYLNGQTQRVLDYIVFPCKIGTKKKQTQHCYSTNNCPFSSSFHISLSCRHDNVSCLIKSHISMLSASFLFKRKNQSRVLLTTLFNKLYYS